MVVLGFALSGLATVSAAGAVPSPVSAQATSLTAEYTLYGDAADGWGFTPTNISNPGPTLTVAVGEVVTLNLISHDAPTTHNWFIAMDGGYTPTGSEPSSANFSSSTTAVVYTFTVPNNVGTYTYRCRFHPTTMTGQITITPAPTYVLWGDAVKGWGFGPNNITQPGPTLTVKQGEQVILALYSHDNVTHYFFVSYDGLMAPSANEPRSADFNSSIAPLIFEFTPNQSGNYTYYCGIHPTTMSGTITIVPSQGSTNTPPPPSDVTTYAVVIILIVILAVVVALLVRRRPKTPAPPPQEPPKAP